MNQTNKMKRSNILKMIFTAALAVFSISSCSAEPNPKLSKMPEKEITTPQEGQEEISLGAGCFWCVEAVYKQLDGVLGVTSGYQGGHVDDPTYEQICTGATGHAEVVHLVYDPKKITTQEILEWFWKLHDPTQLNRQGNDIGTQYRSVIFYYTDEQKAIAEASMKEAQGSFSKPIVTVIEKAPKFYQAEVSHQDYYSLNKNKNPYCRAVITPKLEKLGLEK